MTLRRVPAVLREHGPVVLILLTLIGFCTKTLFEYPLAIMVVLGGVRLAREARGLWANPAIRSLAIAFLALWLPMVAALPDAVAPVDSLLTTAPYLRFALAGIYVVDVLSDDATRRRVTLGTFCIVTVWALDGTLQFIAGRDLLGYPYDRDQLAGMFYPKMRIGHVLAVLSPVYFDFVLRQRTTRPWLALLLIPLVLVIALSGKRAAWLMFAFACVAYVVAYVAMERSRSWRMPVLGASAAALALVGGLALFHAPFAARLTDTLGLFADDEALVDQATSHRLSLWRTAENMLEANAVNGIGARGYRHVYSQYAEPDDFWIARGSTGQTHPHQMLLEIGAETGVLGLLGFIVFFVAVWRGCVRNTAAIPWAVAVMVAALPLNSHLAFYGAYWSALLWWTTSIGLAIGGTRTADVSTVR